MSGSPVIGVIGAEPWGSVDHLFRTIGELLATRFEVEHGAQGRPDRVRDRARLERCDLLIGRTAAHMALRDELRLDRPVIYIPLGELPLGVPYLARLAARFRSYDTIAFSCAADRAIFDRLIPVCRVRSVVLPYFVDVDRMTPPAPDRRAEVRTRLGIAPGEVLFAYVGRVRSDKNVHAVLRAFAHVTARVPGARLIVVGAVGESPSELFARPAWDMAAVIAGLIDHFGLTDRVTLHDAVDHATLPELYGAADIAINLTLHETENFGFAQAEAAACGVPVIGSRWGGLKDVVEHGATGWGADTRVTAWGVHVDLGQVVEAATELASSAEARAVMGATARRRAVERFSITTFAANLIAEVEDCLRRVRDGDAGPAATTTPLARRLARRRGMFDRRSYPTYAEMIEPYASHRSGAELVPGARYFTAPLSISLGPRSRALDLLWPGTYALDAGERRLLAAMVERELVEPTATPDELAAATRRRRVDPTLRSLLGRGLVVPSLPLPRHPTR